jgi:hypothetical protein
VSAIVAAGAPASAGAELRRGATSIRVALEPGAPITSFACEGHEWCAGSWQDYAPTHGACALPTFVAGAAGARFRNGGTFLSDEPTVDVRADGAANAITVSWPASTYPLSWTRTVSLDADGAVRIGYAVSNGQRVPLPFTWGLPLSLAWSEDTGLELPRGARARVAESHGDGLAPASSEFTWPSLRDGGHLVDLTRPAALGAGRALLCFVELPRARFSVRRGDRALEIRSEPGSLTHVRVRINNGVADPDGPRRSWWRRRSAPMSLQVGPTVGAPDLLSDAVGAWSAARWLEPGETVRWDVRIRQIALEV